MNIDYDRTGYSWMNLTMELGNTTIVEAVHDSEYGDHLDIHLQAISDLQKAAKLSDKEMYNLLRAWGLTGHIDQECNDLLENLENEEGLHLDTHNAIYYLNKTLEGEG